MRIFGHRILQLLHVWTQCSHASRVTYCLESNGKDGYSNTESGNDDSLPVWYMCEQMDL